MGDKKDLKFVSAISLVSLIAAAAILCAVCILPQVMISRLDQTIAPLAEEAIRLVHNGDTENVVPIMGSILEAYEKEHDAIKTFYSHHEAAQLRYAILTALELAKEGDVTQLLTELTAIENELHVMKHLNEARLINLF